MRSFRTPNQGSGTSENRLQITAVRGFSLPVRLGLFDPLNSHVLGPKAGKSSPIRRSIRATLGRTVLERVPGSLSASSQCSLRSSEDLGPALGCRCFLVTPVCLGQLESSILEAVAASHNKLSQSRITILIFLVCPTNLHIQHTILKVKTKWSAFRTVGHGNDTRTCRSPMGPFARKRSGPRCSWHRVRVWSRNQGTEPMYDKATRGLESPDRQTESANNNATCPHCETAILAIVTSGPTEHFFDPCGCRASPTVRNLVGGVDHGRGVATDGGTFNCDDCGEEGSVDDATALMQPGGEDASLICPDCQVNHPYDRQFTPTNPAALLSEDGGAK